MFSKFLMFFFFKFFYYFNKNDLDFLVLRPVRIDAPFK